MPHGNDGVKTVRADTVREAVRARLTQADVALRAADAETDPRQVAAQLREARAHVANAAMVVAFSVEVQL